MSLDFTILRRSRALWLAMLVLVAPLAAQEVDPPSEPPRADAELVYARAFTLEQPEAFAYRAERPLVEAGVVLVLRMDPALLAVHQAADPVLFVGEQTAERVNLGDRSGHLVVIVPVPLDDRGRPDFDLTDMPVFFGQARLPESVDEAALRAEVEAARERGLTPFGDDAVAAALDTTVAFPDAHALHVWTADLVERFSPEETDLVSGLRAPRLVR